MMTALRLLLDKSARPLPVRVQRVLLATASIAMVIATIWAWTANDFTFDDLTWWPLIALMFGTAPLSLLLKALEFRVAAAVAGQHPAMGRSLTVAVVSSAANLLPVPGSLIVTVRSLSEDGATYGNAMSASAVPGLAWLGITGIVGGVAIGIEGPDALGAIAVACGVGAGVAAAMFLRAAVPRGSRARIVAAVLLVESGWLGVSALRLGLAVTALGVSVTPTQAVALSVAGAITVAIGFFPGGLGLREALITALGPLIGLEIGTGVLLGTIDRLVWLSFLAVAGSVLAIRRR